MEFFYPRKLKFKAWNTDTRLLMRLHNIDCIKGELMKKDHILLQFTGLHDKLDEEVYDMDILLRDNKKYIVHWNSDFNAWTIVLLENTKESLPAIKTFVAGAIRLRSYFETGE